MTKKVCPNGHVYDQSIYGDTCPLCPSVQTSANAPQVNPTMAVQNEIPQAAAHTKVQPGPAVANSPQPMGMGAIPPHADPVGSTKVAPVIRQQQQAASQPQAGKTVIRHNASMTAGGIKPGEEGRKLVGFLVTYNRTPMGRAFNIYEGRNVVGRDASCDISIPDDNQMSGKHMSIRYLSGNNKFRFHDEMSSNGTYVNKELLDDGELQNYDIIRIGSTLFIFIAIPQI